MASTTTPLMKPLSMAERCVFSSPSIFTSKTPSPFLSLHSKPIKFINISCSYFPSCLSLKHSVSQSILLPHVAQTSEWAQQEEEDEIPAELGDETVEGEGSFPEPSEEAKLFVGNLPFDIDSEKLAQLFNQAGVVEIAEVIYNRETDQSRGFGFVTMSTVAEAEKAVEMFHQFEVNGRQLAVNKAAPRGSRPERAPRVFEPSLRIYVGNLPWQVDSARLEQIFSEHGTVVNANVVSDRETGRSRGFGFVTMSDETETNDAIAALDGKSLDGRAIRVNVAEERPRRGAGGGSFNFR